MKRNIIVTIIITFSILAFAPAKSFSLDNYPFGAGISVLTKMGINASEVRTDYQNALSYLGGVDVAAMVYVPMANDSRTGVFFEVGYTNTPWAIKRYYDKEVSEINQKYLTISPIIMMSGFCIGADLGFKVFDNWVDEKVLFGLLPYDDDFNLNLRIGGMMPLYTTEMGTLNFVVNASYSVTGSTCGDVTYHPATISLGFNYLFDLESPDDY
jgi:hypothetical protein